MFLALPNKPKITFDFPVPDFIRSLGNSTQTNTQTQTTSTTNAPNSTTQGTNINLGNLKISAEEQELLLRLIHAEAGGEGIVGMAAVAKSILNRYALVQSGKVKPSEFGAKGTTLKDIIEAPGQYQPFAQGKLNTPLSAANRDKALQALNLALNPEALKKQLQTSGQSLDQINKTMAATGFRAGYAFNDPSQNVNNVALGNHTFNTAGNIGLVTFA
jgi:spore germination cell wall hydrolase CwlJ-like protein